VFLQPCSPVGRPEDDGPSFRLRVDLVSGLLTMSGQLDRRTAHLLYDTISALLFTGGERWTVDVAELTVGDAAGLRAISITYRRLLRHGRQMTLRGPSPALRQGLTRLRLGHHVLDAAAGRPTAVGAASA
jgi:anti-anti-sigma factor